MIQLRDYQKECVEIIDKKGSGRFMLVLATGLGKTVTFANLKRKGRMLILSHREELANQPRKYFDCSYGIEQGQNHSNGEEVVSASVQTLVRRLENFQPDDFDIIVVDECHHAASKTYRKILDYFKPRQLIGVTATPNRSDKARLDDIFDEIVFKKDIRWGIKNHFLCDIFCKRIDVGYDLTNVHTSMGDYAPGELADALQGTEDAVAQAYREHAKGATLIFAVNVAHAQAIAERIEGAVAVTGMTPNRAEIIERFTRREIPCIVNCAVFTEGTDMPLVETVIMARPTQSDALYTQCVGRGLRLHPDKDKLTLIDCVGVTGKRSLCTAPTLIGVDLSDIPQKRLAEVQGELFELPMKAEQAADCPSSWIKNVQIVNLWAQEQRYNTHDMNLFKMPDGSLVCHLPDCKPYVIPPADELGKVYINMGTEYVEMQEALDRLYTKLKEYHSEQEVIWNVAIAKRWGKAPATEKQVKLIQRKLKAKRMADDIDYNTLTKFEASQILNRIMK